MNIHIKNGRVVDPAQQLDGQHDLFISDGKIAHYDQAPDGFIVDQIIDAQGLVVSPGFIDLSVQLREPGFEYLATLDSEMQAAMAGGVTSVVIPPDTDPVLDEPSLIDMLCMKARKLNCAHVYPMGALTRGLKGKQLSELCQLTESGCIAFGQATYPIQDTDVLYKAMQYAASFGYRVWLRPIDAFLGKSGFAHLGPHAVKLGLTGIPVSTETIALYTYLELARITGVKLHINHLSSERGLQLVKAAREQGIDVTCDITINHLHLCDEDSGYFDTNCRFNPPLRSASDLKALRTGLSDGSVNAVCSQHLPVNADGKLGSFAEVEQGATGLELLLSLTLQWQQQNQLTLLQALSQITSNAANIAGITKAGHLKVGARADICIFDEQAQVTISEQFLRSQGKNTPFIGQTLPGKVCYTLVEGCIMYQVA